MQRQVCGNCMEGKSAPPVMIPMSRSSRDYRASKNPKNRLALAIETSCGRSGSATQPLRPASSRSKRAADANGDVTLETLRLSKKSKIGISLANGEASADDNEALIRKNSKSEGLRRKQATGTASQSKTSEATASDNALNALKLSESGAGSAGSTSHSEDTNTVGGSVFQISEGAVNAAGSSEPPELTEQRSLRPRPKPPVVKKVVKRTRFHEVSLGDSDGPHIVGRRIKVFWPLDKKWYYGSVKAYNSAKKQHKIIYDDHDEEWLKLQKESFRLEVLSGDAFGYAAPSSDLAAELVDSVSIAECDESNKHRGDAVDGSTSASDDKPAAERTGVRRSKVGRERESEKRRKVSEGVSEEGKKLDGPGPSEHRKKAGRVNEQKKKLEGDREPKKKPEGSAERGKKTDSAKGLERKRGDAKQRATKGEKLGRGNAKRAVLEVYERRKKRAQSVGTSGPGDRKGKGIAADGLNDRRKRAGKESSRKGSVSQTRTRHSATESTDGKKVSRRGIRDNDRLFASIKSSAVIRRKVAESKRSKDQKPVGSPSVQVKSSSVEDHEAPEDEEKVFPRPQAAEAGLELLTLRREERIARAANAIDPLSPVQNKTDHECGTVGSPVTSTVDVTNDEDDTTCEADSPTSVHDTTSDDKAKSEECTSCDDEALPSSDSVPSSRTLGLDEATGAMCGDQMSGEMVVCQRSISTTEHVDLDTESRSLAAECVERSPEEAVHIGCDADAEDCTLQSMDLRFEFPPSTVEESSNQEVVLDKASYAAAGPVLLSTSATRILPEVYPRTMMRRCTDVGTYYGLPSIESFLRISADFWRRVFQKQAAFEEVNTDCALDSVPVVEEAMGGLFSQWPEVSSVDTVDDEDLSDTEDRLQISSAAEGPGVCESFNADISKKDDNGEDFDSMKASLDSQAQSAEGRRAGKGLKRGFVDASPATICDGADGEYPLGDDALSGRPYSKRTRAEIESSGAAVITDSVDTSSPSDVDGNGCPAPSSAAEPKADESSLPRVNVLKLRRCPTNKGLWRVAGNSCAAPQDRSMSGLAFEVRDTGDGAEPMTPVFETSRKRALDQCSESSLPGRNDQSGNSVLTSTFSSNLTVCSPSSLDQDMIGANTNKAFSLNSKSKEVWYDCGMTFMNEVAAEGLEPRKRRRKGPSPVHGDDVEALSEHSLRRSTDSGWVPCSANVLITRSDRCLRETGAIVELQSGHGNSWILSVFLHGESKFAYKADQPVATGTSNKFTHAMMWRGGKDWSLEFVDRKQWQLFKDLHEECFQRSVRAATVRHIPIPGVKPIQELPKTGVRFVRPYSKYIHQSEGEVEAALTSSRVIYDMDSEDEEWLNLVNTEKVSSRGTRSRPRIEEDTLEKVMDKLEKFSFVRPQHEPLLTSEVAAEICQTLGSQEAIRAIHGHWYDKRNRKGMALVRHFQPAPWEQYQRLLEDWQMKVNQLQEDSPTANKQQLQSMCKRPPLFAFCLRPRGLENRNKMQKQRSQRKQGLGGSSSRQWTLAGPASDFFLDSPSKRPTHFESSSGPLYGSRKYGRQRISEDTYTESMAVDLSESFNALASAEGFISSTFSEQVMPIGVGVTFSHAESSPVARTERTTTTRPHKKKKAGRKARKMRLLASAEESKRKRQLRAQQGHVKERFLDMVHSPHSLSQFVQPSVDTPSTSTLSFPQTDSEDVDLEAVAIAKAAEAKRAREEATAKRLRAQALYAVADAAMHKAVAAVIAADAIHASERAMEKAAAMSGQGVEFPEQTGEVPVKDEGSRTRLRTPVTEGGTSFGSWRRALNSASRNANHVLSKGTSSKQGLLPDTDDPLLPVASWSQELGAGLGTRLLQTGEVSPQRQRYSPVLEGLSKSPTRGVVSLGRTRGESMMAMLTR
ncbi:hypothetical protein MPTK1_8g09190 [Marchantia polymorpha subsp. ruderalis]|uniref:Enhancer of polycomb-like protein n=1 Tax=Marchantia polymorpha TaxID=3197 RepID=A0A2R6W2E0_MARPO|nr:hypothetical protein MARPO_0176s0001 [Marchantia polymorpha]BBN19262.1 hypothetical protein Mp_8g09190 [Marchantia polymorpha subsp. ruderalis]|eukprot:PTQ28015.1 hypothetical protein MARPO_0176s0001 [Marchantia polymorpha]